MRTTTIILISLLFATNAYCPSNPQLQVIKAIEQTLKRNSSKKAVPAIILAPAILHLSDAYGVSPYTIMRIVLVESRGISSAYNKRTKDYGLMQLNERTMRAYGITKQCALNWICNLEAGISILSDISDGRICRYNVGSGKLKTEKLKRCLKYEQRLASIN